MSRTVRAAKRLVRRGRLERGLVANLVDGILRSYYLSLYSSSWETFFLPPTRVLTIIAQVGYRRELGMSTFLTTLALSHPLLPGA